MKRGDVVVVAERGPLTGKPRPAVVVQNDDTMAQASRVTVALVSSGATDLPIFRIPIMPDARNGLARPSCIMADRLTTVQKSSVGAVIGTINGSTMQALEIAIKRWLDL
jgi:mRNA interferase MazF